VPLSRQAVTRGSDLSGSLEGAGGIGGLLARSHAYQSGSGDFTNHNCYHADGSGNITYLVNSSQTVAASYRYDPYGNTISSSGTLASANVYRFSSKEIHVNSGLYYFGYRWYHPNLQRWLNRDPIGERGGLNLYRFLRNDPTVQIDPFGLECPPFELPSRGPLRLELPKKKKRFSLGMTLDGQEIEELTGTYSLGKDLDFSVSGNPSSGNVNMKIGGPIGGGWSMSATGSPNTGGGGLNIGYSLGGGL
jgi:RHS repeat-associated protein